MSQTPPSWKPPSEWPVPRFTGDQLADYQADSLLAAENACQMLNNTKIFIYYGRFAAFAQSVQAGAIDNKLPPAVPPAWALIIVNDGGGDIYSYDLGSSPVCAALPVPPMPPPPDNPPVNPPGVAVVGHHNQAKWYSVGSGDTFPADGPTGGVTYPVANLDDPTTLHTYQKYPAAVGPGWYLQLS